MTNGSRVNGTVRLLDGWDFPVVLIAVVVERLLSKNFSRNAISMKKEKIKFESGITVTSCEIW